MVRIVEKTLKPVYNMIDTWKKDNSNNKKGFYKQFEDENEAVEICDLHNLDKYGFYTNRYIIRRA